MPLALLFVAACEQASPLPQALVVVDTDLEVPRLADQLELTLLSEVTLDGGAATLTEACEGCVLQVDLNRQTPPWTFGVEPEGSSGALFARATLHRSGRSDSSGPWPETSVDRIVRLTMGPGVAAQSLFLPASCAGIPPDMFSETSCGDGVTGPIDTAPPSSRTGASRAGQFGRQLAHDCPPPDPGWPETAACVPGGVYWMGDYRRVGLGGARDAWPEHLVALRGFYLDRVEYSVGRYREALAAGFEGGALRTPDADDTGQPATLCNFTRPDGDAYPLNCVPRELAAALCRFEGGRLPSEAEWEWAAGNGEAETLYPSGAEPPSCAASTACERSVSTPVALSPSLPVGSYAQDRNERGVLDLASNVAEWMRDDFQSYEGSCWQPSASKAAPVCRDATTELASVRGGYAGGDRCERMEWGCDSELGFVVASRWALPAGGRDARVGFRCAWGAP